VDGSQASENRANNTIRFRCSFCGQKIRISKGQAGAKAKCPKCGSIVLVPQADTPQTTPNEDQPIRLERQPALPHTDDARPYAPAQPQTPTLATDDIQLFRGAPRIGASQPEAPPQRKLPWLVDIFLYPTNAAGLTVLGIIIGIPLIIRAFAWFFRLAMTQFPPFLVFFAIFIFFGWVIRFIIWAYAYWYFCECIQDSAFGAIRAPETLSKTPGLGEMFWQLVRVMACLGLCIGPAVLYSCLTWRQDLTFWILLGCGIFYYPMALLAIVVFDSFYGLNPLLVIPSIFSTFLQYCALLVFYCLLFLGVAYAIRALWPGRPSFFTYEPFAIYLFIVAAHLLGRFFFRYKDKLNWEV